MKKTVMSAVSVFVLSTCCATGFSQATTQSVGGGSPRPMSVGGGNPRPQSVGGGNPRPTGNTVPATSTISAILMALGII